MTSHELLTALRQELDAQGVLCGAAVGERQATFWNTGPMSALAILRPATVDQLCACMRLCHAARQPVVVLGGNTGLVEGTACGPRDIIVSLERLNRIEQVDVLSRTVVVQAGVVLQTLQERLAEQQWMFPVDLGARGSCQVGGMIATNAGGFSVLAHGMMREQVLGIEVVLADGSRLSSMQGFVKNNTGYDLKHLFIGSEGTLGIVTRAVLRIAPKLGGRASALIGVDDFAQVVGLLESLQRQGGCGLTAFEVMWPGFWRLNTGPHSGLRAPLAGAHSHYVLLEYQGGAQDEVQAQLEQRLEQAFEQGLVADAVLARNEAERSGLWAIREAYEVEQRLFARTQGFDVSLATADMQPFVAELEQRLAALQAEAALLVFGHLADGNLHVTFALQEPLPAPHVVEALFYQTLARFSGSISAEHGIGLEKKAYLALTRNADELHWMLRLKQLFDPLGLLNPGKVLDMPESYLL